MAGAPVAAQMPSPSPSPTASPTPSPTPTPTPTPSPEPPVEVKAAVHLAHVELFGRAVITGRVTPDVDARPLVKLKRNGKTVTQRRVDLRKDGRFTIRLRIARPGSYRASIIVAGSGIERAQEETGSHSPALPALPQGARGGYVGRLERRLKALGYYLPATNRYFGVETSDALLAFNKIQRTARVGTVNEATWRALADPIRPRPQTKSPWHFEIDQTRQVILVVKDGKVRWILHTSTGAGGATHDGTYSVHRKLAGYSVGRLYYPSYWDGLRAFHGWPEVPTYPASHGCARVPMWSAQWMYSLARIGDTVHVYH